MDGAAQIGDHRRQIARLRHKLRYGFIRNRCGHAPSLRALSLLCHNASLSPLRNRENAANPRAPPDPGQTVWKMGRSALVAGAGCG
jgi:hypothetical protein